MKTINYIITLLALLILLLISCSEQVSSPVESDFQTLNKGNVVNKVTGSGHLTMDEKIYVLTINAREYADGTFSGQYEVNLQAAYQVMEHGDVLFLKIYYNVPGYGTVAMVGGQVKNSNVPGQVGIYECYVIVDNGPEADQQGFFIPYILTLEHAEEYWNSYPTDFIDGFTTSWGYYWPGSGIIQCDLGNFTIH